MVVIATRAKTYYFFTGLQNYAKNKKLPCHAMQEGLQNNKILKLPMSLTGTCSQSLSVLFSHAKPVVSVLSLHERNLIC